MRYEPPEMRYEPSKIRYEFIEKSCELEEIDCEPIEPLEIRINKLKRVKPVEELIEIDSDGDEIVSVEEKRPVVAKKINEPKDSDDDLPDIGLPSVQLATSSFDYLPEKRNMSDLTNKKLDAKLKPKKQTNEDLSLTQRIGTALLNKLSGTYNDPKPNQPSISSGSSNNKRDDTSSALFTLLPGSFEVILFVDNCEQSHA